MNASIYVVKLNRCVVITLLTRYGSLLLVFFFVRYQRPFKIIKCLALNTKLMGFE